jgi:hypothetical protein
MVHKNFFADGWELIVEVRCETDWKLIPRWVYRLDQTTIAT